MKTKLKAILLGSFFIVGCCYAMNVAETSDWFRVLVHTDLPSQVNVKRTSRRIFPTTQIEFSASCDVFLHVYLRNLHSPSIKPLFSLIVFKLCTKVTGNGIDLLFRLNYSVIGKIRNCLMKFGNLASISMETDANVLLF